MSIKMQDISVRRINGATGFDIEAQLVLESAIHIPFVEIKTSDEIDKMNHDAMMSVLSYAYNDLVPIFHAVAFLAELNVRDPEQLEIIDKAKADFKSILMGE